MATGAHFRWPSARSFVAAYAQFLMAADIFRRAFEVPDHCKHSDRVRESGRAEAKRREVVLVFETAPTGELKKHSEKSSFFAFLPIAHETRLPFILHCDFILNTTRSSIEETLEWNAWLLQSSGDVFLEDAVKAFKKGKLTKYDFDKFIPEPDIWNPDNYLRRHLLNPLWERYREADIVLSSTGEWVKPGQAVLAPEGLPGLVDTARLNEIMGRTAYVDAQTAGHQVLQRLGVERLGLNEIARIMESAAWLARKPSRWLVDLYEFFLAWRDREPYRQWELRESMAVLPIVRTVDRKQVAADDGVLFPPKRARERELAQHLPGITLVKSSLAKGKSREFLEWLGIEDFGDDEAINQMLETTEDEAWRSWSPEQRDDALHLLQDWLRVRRWQVPTNLRDRAALTPLPAADADWRPAQELYLSNPKLEVLCPDCEWVAARPDPDWERFVTALGVSSYLRLDQSDKPRSQWSPPEGVERWHEYWQSVDQFKGKRKSIGGIKWLPVLDEPLSDEQGKALAEIIADNWSSYYSRFNDSSFYFFYHTSKSERIESYFQWQLQNTRWLPTSRGLMKPGREIFIPSDELRQFYGELPAYLRLPRDTRSKGHALWEKLGLISGVTPEATAVVLRAVAGRGSSAVTKQQLGALYAELGRRIAAEPHRAWQWNSALRDVPVLAESGRFLRNRTPSLLWADDRERADLFADAFDFVWFPEDLERPSVAALFKVCAIGGLSEKLTAHVDASAARTAVPDKFGTTAISARAHLLLSCLAHKRPKDIQVARGILASLKVLRLNQVRVEWDLNGERRIALAKAFLDREHMTLYCGEEATHFDVAVELCRVFGVEKAFTPTLQLVLDQELREAARCLELLGIALLAAGPENDARRRKADARSAEPALPVDEVTVSLADPTQEGEAPAADTSVASTFRTHPSTVHRTQPPTAGWLRGWDGDEDVTKIPTPPTTVSAQSSDDGPDILVDLLDQVESVDEPEAEVTALPPLGELTIAAIAYIPGSGTTHRIRHRGTFRASEVLGDDDSGQQTRLSPTLSGRRAEAIAHLFEIRRLSRHGSETC